jgi:general stress protein 26
MGGAPVDPAAAEREEGAILDSREFTVETTDFGEIAAEFHERVAHMIWCNMATVDAQCRPRSRIVHPIWDGRIGLMGTWRTSGRSGHQTPSIKVRQVTNNPHVSLAYISDAAKPVFVDGQAEVVDDPDEKRRFWDLAKSTPEPYGYDPGEAFSTPDDPRFAVLRVTPHRIVLVDFPAPPGQVIVWRG